MTQKIIRIDKGDGFEMEVTREEMKRAIANNYKLPSLVLTEFDAGYRIATPFAYYELRKEEKADRAEPGV